MKKYISLEIFKNRGRDWSNGGLSDNYNTCYIECERGWISEENVPEDAIVKVVKGAFGSIHLEPIKAVPSDSVGYMFGGCYVATSDSRFGELIEKETGIDFYGAVALHDRTETCHEYEMLSR